MLSFALTSEKTNMNSIKKYYLILEMLYFNSRQTYEGSNTNTVINKLLKICFPYKELLTLKQNKLQFNNLLTTYILQ